PIQAFLGLGEGPCIRLGGLQLQGVVELHLVANPLVATPMGGGHAHGDLRQPGGRLGSFRDKAPAAVCYHEYFLHEIVQLRTAYPQPPQEPCDEDGVAPEQLSSIESLLGPVTHWPIRST